MRALVAAAALLAATPALAETPVAIVRHLYDVRLDEPAHEPNGYRIPIGGYDVWSEAMQVRWRDYASRESVFLMDPDADWSGEGLTFDFLANSQEDDLQDLEIRSTGESADSAIVSATFDNGADTRQEVLFAFTRDADRWLIDEVTSPTGDWTLSILVDESYR